MGTGGRGEAEVSWGEGTLDWVVGVEREYIGEYIGSFDSPGGGLLNLRS